MSFADFLADAQAIRDRGEWWVECYVDDADGNQEILRFSRRGTPAPAAAVTVGADSISAHTPFPKRILQAPELKQSLWSGGTVGGSSIPAPGKLLLRNADGGLDQYRPAAGYKWRGRQIKVFFLDAADPVGTAGKVFDGVMGEATFGLDEVEIEVVSRERIFAATTSDRVYRGTGWMLETDAGSGNTAADFGAPAALDLGGPAGEVTVEGWVWIENFGSGASFYGWVGGTGRPFDLFVGSGGNLVMRASVGGTNEDVSSTFTLDAQKPYHVAGTIDDDANEVRFFIWDDDAQAETRETHTSAYSGARDAVAGGATLQLRVQGAASCWWDDMRIWDVVRTPGQLATYRHTEYPGEVSADYPASLVHYPKCNDGTGTTVTDYSATGADGTISSTGTGSHTWLRGIEGEDDLGGTPKPDLWGRRWGLLPVLVDPIDQVYQVAGDPVGIQSILGVYEGGNLVGSPTYSDAASLRAFLTTTPGSGTVLTYLQRGLFKLGSAPTLPILVEAEGYDGGALGYVSSAANIARDLITRRGPQLTDPGDLDTSSFSALETANDAVLGLYLRAPIPIGQALDMVLGSVGAWWGYERGSAQFHVERFTGPSAQDHTFDERDLAERKFKPQSSEVVVYRVNVKFRPSDMELSEDQVAGAVIGTAGWQQWTKEWREKSAADWNLRGDFPDAGSRVVTVESLFYSPIAALAEANRLLNLYGGVQEHYKATVRHPGVAVSVGESVSLSFTTQNGETRLGLDATDPSASLFIVLSTDDALQQGEVALELWRGSL